MQRLRNRTRDKFDGNEFLRFLIPHKPRLSRTAFAQKMQSLEVLPHAEFVPLLRGLVLVLVDRLVELHNVLCFPRRLRWLTAALTHSVGRLCERERRTRDEKLA